jgi:predicted dehydrogenase
MSEPRICVVGAGNLSSRRIYPYIAQAGGRLVGSCDRVRERSEAIARRFGGAAYDDMEAMLDAEQPDAVIICIGPREHAELASAVLRRKIPVYTEKPPALTAGDALFVARAAKDAGVPCTTAFKKRYATAYTRAKEWLAQYSERDWLALAIDYASAHYRNETAAGSFLLDFAIHIIDLAGYLFGDASEVFTYSKGGHAYAVSIRFASGAVGSLSLNDGRSFLVPTEEVELTVAGGHFMTIHNSASWRITQDGKPSEWREPPTFVSAGDSGRDTGHLTELEEFMRSVADCHPTRSDIYASYKSMVLYEAIDRSARTGQTIAIHYEPL